MIAAQNTRQEIEKEMFRNKILITEWNKKNRILLMHTVRYRYRLMSVKYLKRSIIIWTKKK